MLVAAVEARPLRSLSDVRVELGGGIVSLVGPNGTGKTNLLEALYFALTGRSFRTSDRREMIPASGRSSPAPRPSSATRTGAEHALLASVSRAEGRRHLLDGSPADPADHGAPPAPGRGLLAGSAGAGQGPAGGAPRPPRRAMSRPAGPRAPSCAGATGRRSRSATPFSRASPAGRRGGISTVWDVALAEPPRRWSARPRGGGRDLAPPLPPPPRSSACGGGDARVRSTRRGIAEEIRAGLRERREADVPAWRAPRGGLIWTS